MTNVTNVIKNKSYTTNHHMVIQLLETPHLARHSLTSSFTLSAH